MRFYCFSFVLLILGFSNLQAQDPLRFEQEIEQLKKKSFPTNQEGPKLVFAGSSSIRMWTDLAAAFPEHRVINMGFGGSQMSDLFYFLPDLVIRHQPERVYIYEGDNDLAEEKSIKEVMNNTHAVIAALRASLPGVQIYFISPKPSISRWNLRRKYGKLNKQLDKLCSKYKDLYFIDVWNPMLTSKGELRPELFIEDGLHMNADGYAIWQAQIKPFLP